MRSTRTGPRTAAGRLLVAGALLAAPLTGCGIRTTTVPVDAGPAPSRTSCAVPHAGTAPEAETVVRQVYLVCGLQITPVRRSVPRRAGAFDRIAEVRELLAQLQRGPLTAESQAGFSTAVPATLAVAGPRATDPRDTLRLSQPLDELPSFALAQIVCTLTAAGTQIAPDRTVTLAGSPPSTTARVYTCTPALRTTPDPADTAGVPVQ
ncbi:hypothetical protein [Streptomyces sp.]|uniref:hypothetical protein n=1 Tax=Streptomyces sp. TaxID=1931 RepID=UPI002F41308C